jgi:hypothetical protein
LHQSVIERFSTEHKEQIQSMEAAVAAGKLPVSSALDALLA